MREPVIRFATIDDDRLASLAPAHWRRKAARMRFAADARRELVAGGLLADMLGRTDLDVVLSPEGKPSLDGGPHFSLSHSHDVVMCVLADRPVGCDVEKIVPLDGDLRAAVGSIPAWTLAEAVYKCGVAGRKARSVNAPSGYAAALCL